MSGPVRCAKQGPGRPVPEHPPEVVVLPPTDRSSFTAPPELEEAVRHFNAGEYRACVEPLEALFFARRNTFHQGLLQYVVALMQLRRGMVRSPRRLLRQALAFFAPYPDWQEGIALAEVRRHAEALLERLPDGVVEAPPEAAEAWWIAPPAL